MTDSQADAGKRLTYRTPEVRSLGTIADITAAGQGSGLDSGGYSSEHGGHPGGS